ncbi:MAG: nuclear transport factor 2 family protein [Crocinitomicaceae bacterium]|nr:nuclear transport factor 2 family protein [Crocinitomicaceae bacterium]
MKQSIVVFLVLLASNLIAQVHPATIVEEFYEDLNSGDSSKIRSYFFDEAVIEHLDKDTTYGFTIDGFMTIAPKFKSKMYQEEILHIDMTIPPSFLAYTVIVDFKFFFNGEYHHCGQDIFMVQTTSDYRSSKFLKVISMDTECWEQSSYEKEKEEEFNKQKQWSVSECERIMNRWHQDAADANLQGYFEVMADSFYYLGTDPNERWSKSEFETFCMPYFEKGTTWYFEAERRNWAISDDGNVCWFDEYLFTQNMDYCRGSGVLQKVDGKWKLFHYNLTVLIENEKMKQFLKLRKK